MILSTQLLILIIIASCISSIGWYKFVYFISLGYGFSVAGMGIGLIAMFFGKLSPINYLLPLLLIIYGCRLGGFLLFREIKSASYKKALPELTKTSKPMTAGVKLAIWVSVVFMYVCQISPILFRFTNATSQHNHNISTLWLIIGSSIMALALILESIADLQKSAAKKVNPKRFCDKGLYKIVRCPNYFAEILFWTGVFITSVKNLNSFGQWIFATIGYIAIVYIMFGGARRLEIRQSKNYGNDEEYQKYTKKTPILIPLVPLYHLENASFFKG